MTSHWIKQSIRMNKFNLKSLECYKATHNMNLLTVSNWNWIVAQRKPSDKLLYLDKGSIMLHDLNRWSCSPSSCYSRTCNWPDPLRSKLLSTVGHDDLRLPSAQPDFAVPGESQLRSSFHQLIGPLFSVVICKKKKKPIIFDAITWQSH